ncbi:hypothetical protein JCM15415_17970 [Methanobacterium movens]
MIEWDEFEKIVTEKLGRAIKKVDNPPQNQAISSPKNQSLFLVAGPGSGKTTVMVLKILKFIFVDDIPPSSILATTFTRKAASELRSRILSWGDEIRQYLLNDKQYSKIHPKLKNLDFNQIITGTLDSISEDVLRTHRDPGSPPPVVIEDFVASALMMQVGLFKEDRYHVKDLKEFLVELRGTSYKFNVAEMAKLLLEIKDHIYYDQVDFKKLKQEETALGPQLAFKAIEDYIQELDSRFLYDFAMLEAKFLRVLKEGKLEDFLSQLKLVLVDEYQDTNLLQEQIYFQFAQAALKNGGSITVVGDDDQSLYHFRGATVDLFTNFKTRIQDQLGIEVGLINLSKNYRSTKNIVNLCNYFAQLDPHFQEVRVDSKPLIEAARNPNHTDFPILGMFRKNVDILAYDLSRFIKKVIQGEGVNIQYKGEDLLIKAHPQEGSAADISILCSSPLERNASGKKRLPLHLREQLMRNPSMEVFNPRGEDLERVKEAQVLCGLILECLDPESVFENDIEKLPLAARKNFHTWRKEAHKFIETNPEPHKPVSLIQFVEAWQKRKPLGRKSWIREVTVMELAYKLVTWIKPLQEDVEGLVYLEAVTRTVAQTGLFSSFGGEIIFDSKIPELEQKSIEDAIWNIMVPLATGAIEVDENLLDTLPSNRISIMSVHQAKGLEFPLVVVDVGSEFRVNHHTQAFKRYPQDGGKSSNLEDFLRKYSPLGTPPRTPRDRAFDDLFRLYFVSYSRAQDVLLLVGLKSVMEGYQDGKQIPNVATGWDRNHNWPGLNDIIFI